MSDPSSELQKARTRLVETRRDMATAIAAAMSVSPERASEFAEIQTAIEAIDDAIRDEANLSGAGFLPP